MPNQKNIAAVADLTERLKKAEVAIMLDYRGLNAEETEKLRSDARKAGVDLRVSKNRLVKLALKNLGYDTLDSMLKEPTMVAFGYADPVTAPKMVLEFIKSNDKLKLKGALYDRKALSTDGVKELSQLPTKDQLIARLLGSIGPSNSLGRAMRSMKNPGTKLMYALQAVAKKKEEAAA